MQIHRVRAALLVLLVLLLATALVACGGDDDDDADDGGNDTTAATQQSDDSNSSDSGDQASDDSEDDDGTASDLPDFGKGLAVVTIGDDRFEFDMTQGFTVCRDVFGGLQFGGSGTDGRDTQVTGWMPPENWDTYDDDRYDPPSIEVENKETNNQWIADQKNAELRGIPEGMSQVDSFSRDGLTASGTATFYDTFNFTDPEPVQGTFEISCEE